MSVVSHPDAVTALLRAADQAFDLLTPLPPVTRISRHQLKTHFHITNEGLDAILLGLKLAATTASFNSVDALQIVQARSESLKMRVKWYV